MVEFILQKAQTIQVFIVEKLNLWLQQRCNFSYLNLLVYTSGLYR